MVNAFLEQVGASCTVYLDTTVVGVRWREGDVQVECTSGGKRGILSADAAVITLPLAVLRLPPGEGGVRFSPSLASKRVGVRTACHRPRGESAPGLRCAVLEGAAATR